METIDEKLFKEKINDIHFESPDEIKTSNYRFQKIIDVIVSIDDGLCNGIKKFEVVSDFVDFICEGYIKSGWNVRVIYTENENIRVLDFTKTDIKLKSLKESE